MTTSSDSPPATSSPARPDSPEGLASGAAHPSESARRQDPEDSGHEDDAGHDDDADGEHDGEDEDDEDEAQAEHSQQPEPLQAQPQVAAADNWQAIYSPAHGAYYFYNTVTHETTWTNPLQPTAAEASSSNSPPEASTSAAASTSTSTPAAVASLYALQEAAVAQGIDPSLAYLDPSLAGPSAPGSDTFTAKFNSRTGAFARPDGRDPSHLSEFERAKRMSQAYFDVGQWEKDLEERNAEEEDSKKRKRPTKKDLVRLVISLFGGALTRLVPQERYKEQKRLKKIAKTAWLRT